MNLNNFNEENNAYLIIMDKTNLRHRCKSGIVIFTRRVA